MSILYYTDKKMFLIASDSSDYGLLLWTLSQYSVSGWLQFIWKKEKKKRLHYLMQNVSIVTILKRAKCSSL